MSQGEIKKCVTCKRTVAFHSSFLLFLCHISRRGQDFSRNKSSTGKQAKTQKTHKIAGVWEHLKSLGPSPTLCPQGFWSWSELCCQSAGFHLRPVLWAGHLLDGNFGPVLQPCLLLLLTGAHGWTLELVHHLLCLELLVDPITSTSSGHVFSLCEPVLLVRACPTLWHDPSGSPSFTSLLGSLCLAGLFQNAVLEGDLSYC